MMAGIEKHRTPLLVQMDKLGKAIFAIILAMMAALFVFSPRCSARSRWASCCSPLISLGGRLRTGRSAGNYLHHPLSGRTGDGAQAGDYPQAADG